MLGQAKRITASVLAVITMMTSLPTFARDTSAPHTTPPPSDTAQAPAAETPTPIIEKTHLRPTAPEVGQALLRVDAIATKTPIKDILLSRAGEAGNLSMTAVFIFMTTLAQVYLDKYHQAKRRGDPSGITDIASRNMLRNTATGILTSEEFWMGMLGGHVASATFIHTAPAIKLGAKAIFTTAEAKDVVEDLIGTSAKKEIMQTFLVSGITSVVTFAGWEAFGQLWREGVMMLSEEQPRGDSDWVKKSHGVAFRVFANRNNPDYQNTEDYQILQHIVLNIGYILSDPVLRDRWEYNTFRLHWMTGDFLAMAGSMGIFPTAGSMLMGSITVGATEGAEGGGVACGGPCAFAGSVLGTIFAFAVTMAMPKSWKDYLSDIARSARSWTNGQQLITNEKELRSTLQDFQRERRLNAYAQTPSNPTEDAKYDGIFTQEMQSRRRIRQHELTALFETYFRAGMKIQTGLDQIDDANNLLQHKENWNQFFVQYQDQTITYQQLRDKVCGEKCDVDYQLKTVQSAFAQIGQAGRYLEPLEMKAMEIYGHEVQLMNRYLNDDQQPLTLQMTKAIQDELVWSCDVSMKLRTILAAESPEMIEALGMDKSFQEAIKTYDLTKKADFQIADFYMNTFDETKLLKQFGDNSESLSALSEDEIKTCINDAKAMAPNTPFW